MAGDLTLALRTTQSGLRASQTALNAVANNVSNVNTPGYSRRIVNLESRVLDGTGAGAQLASLVRKVDDHLMSTIRTELSSFNADDVQKGYYARVQDMFGTPADDTSLVHDVARFTAAVESLAADPDSPIAQHDVVRRGHEVALSFQAMSSTVQDLRRQADAEIAAAVDEINGLLEEVADLGHRIVAADTIGRDVVDLQDARDMALDRLAELIDIKTFDRGNGQLVVFSSGGQVLIDNQPVTLSHEPASRVDAASSHAGGDFAGIFAGKDGSANDITESIRGGRLAGLIDMRDGILPDVQSSLDELAAQMRDEVNRVHNRGTPVPALQEMTGTRRFADPANQTIELQGGDDVAIVLLDADGVEAASTKLTSIMGAGPWTISDVQTALNGWLQTNVGPGATAALDGEGRLTINLNQPDPPLHLAFRDETSAGEPADASIAFDVDGAGGADQTHQGFSAFFGLNDFFVDGRNPGTVESDVVNAGHTVAATTLAFHDGTGTLGSVAVPPATALEDVPSLINSASIGVTASLVPDGAGVRLRIVNDNAAPLSVTDSSGVVGALGLGAAKVGVAQSIDVREDIKASPVRVSRAALQFHTNSGASGRYAVAPGDATAAHQLAETLSTARAFEAAGRMGVSARTFEEYAGAVLGDTSGLADRNADAVQQGSGLVESLQARSNQVRGVNLDEEMSNLILYEQAYSASARVVGTIRSMFEALEQAVT